MNEQKSFDNMSLIEHIEYLNFCMKETGEKLKEATRLIQEKTARGESIFFNNFN